MELLKVTVSKQAVETAVGNDKEVIVDRLVKIRETRGESRSAPGEIWIL